MLRDKCRHPYRVFISYSRADKELADKLEAHLRDCGVVPVRDTSINAGARFSDEIKRQISFSHVFVCLLTSRSKLSPWVHQEMAYAMGLGLPVLPLALDELPEGMAQELLAIQVGPDVADISGQLTPRALQDLVSSAQGRRKAMYECEEHLIGRTQLLVDYASDILHREGPCVVRQRAPFSSFSVPDHRPKHPVWDEVEGTARRPEETRRLLRSERSLLTSHARSAGCHLLIDPYVHIPQGAGEGGDGQPSVFAPTVKRLELLNEFLKSMPDDKVKVGIQQGGIDVNTVILGDWMWAEAVVPPSRIGYRQTVFTRHAPTILSKTEDFDTDLAEALDDAKVAPAQSRLAAVKTIDEIIEKLKKAPSAAS